MELLVVIAIIGIVAAISGPALTAITNSGGLAALDAKSLQLLTHNYQSNNQVTQLAGILPPATGQDPISTWTAAMAQPTFGGSKIPRKVIQSIRLFQRTFYVP